MELKKARLKMVKVRKARLDVLEKYGAKALQVNMADHKLFDLMWCKWVSSKRPPYYKLPELNHIIYKKEEAT